MSDKEKEQLLALVLELVLEECWVEEKNIIHARGLAVYEQALAILEKYGLVKRKTRQIAVLTPIANKLLNFL